MILIVQKYILSSRSRCELAQGLLLLFLIDECHVELKSNFVKFSSILHACVQTASAMIMTLRIETMTPTMYFE